MNGFVKTAQNLALSALPVVLGVLVAGYIMASFRNIAVIDTAHNGFDS